MVFKKTQYHYSDVDIQQSQTVYQGFYRVCRYQVRYPMFLQPQGQEVVREVVIRPAAVVVLPFDPVTDQVVLIEQFRPGLLDQNAESPWLFEVVAGMIEPGEAPESVAIRELAEEAGLAARAIFPIQSYWVSPGGTSEKVYAYWANVDATVAGGVHGLATEHEDIKVHVFPRVDLLEALKAGQLNNGATVMLLQWLALNAHDLPT